jgi:adenine-specific DNA-methyltransferase
MSAAVTTFKTLLRELFQFDCADLDFGIYRIMNQKREAVERFIEQDLAAGVHAALSAGALGEQAEATKELAEVRKAIAETLGEDALDGNGVLAEAYHRTPLGKRYRELQGKDVRMRGEASRRGAEPRRLAVEFMRLAPWRPGEREGKGLSHV